MNFAVPVDCKDKIKEGEKLGKYLDFGRKVKKLWNMTVTVIPIVVGASGTILKALKKRMVELEMRGKTDTTQTTAILKSLTLLKRVVETR